MPTVILNSQLEEVFPTYSNNVDSHFLKAVSNKLPKKSGYNYVSLSEVSGLEESINQGFLGFLSKAYSQHKKVEIAPHDIWYLVMTQISQYIKKNVEACRSLFTKSEDKVTILVPTSDVTKIDLQLVIEQLHKNVPVDVNLFVPELSTLDSKSRLAMYAAFCDGMQVYYNYMTFCCGIPQIRILGTKEDWQTIVSNMKAIARLFESVNISEFAQYLNKVQLLVEKMIENSFVQINPEFWLDIYSKKNIGSGGEFLISGWITEFYFEKCDLPKLENFSSGMSIVPYKNIETGREFVGVNGAFKVVRTEDGFIKCGYDQFIFELTAIT